MSEHTVYLEYKQLEDVTRIVLETPELKSISIKKVNDCYAVTTPEYFEEFDELQYEARVAIYRNFYRCDCGEEWEDEWSATCDDRCPECNSACEPYESEDVEEPYVHE